MSSVPGILHVLSDPGPNVPLTEFHDWYNNEHGPDRMRLSGFTSGLRYEAVDGLLPPWLATYELEDLALLNKPIYIRLRENRSKREAGVVSRLAVLDRYSYELVYSKGTFVPVEGSVLVSVILTVPQEHVMDTIDWYTKEHIGMLSRTPGWFRTRLLRDTSSIPNIVRFIAIHEYAESNGLGGTEHQSSMDTPWRTLIMSRVVGKPSRRVFRLNRIFSRAQTI